MFIGSDSMAVHYYHSLCVVPLFFRLVKMDSSERQMRNDPADQRTETRQMQGNIDPSRAEPACG